MASYRVSNNAIIFRWRDHREPMGRVDERGCLWLKMGSGSETYLSLGSRDDYLAIALTQWVDEIRRSVSQRKKPQTAIDSPS